ncbi:hypothetical protein BUALT_Bualt14G0081100 [Buddleja alternifolia]|uniref:F-box/LRR-repeat protein 15/At3g58940/PEG3-like LRR domain-containing protein n=1 Tax=Buddleja alternifolia TaxID=168488 RepID=A0AAV6WPA2_9LAMI|nr:hypothetical protein BUALT_Bualt14G0081100 [Buddleja alternifolia]
MERDKRGEAINGEIQLPEAIIQQIQSLLNGKQALRTSVLSKSWYNAWLTSPNLDFDVRNFENRRIGDSKSEAADRFRSFVKKTMKRYQELNLKIVKFRVWMRVSKPNLVSFANELILKALKMGVIDLNLEFPSYYYEMYALPHEVLEAETLIRLSAIGCKIDWPLDRKILCSRLESLSLSKVWVGEDVFWHIISSCPLIENVLLSGCRYIVGVDKFRQTTEILTLRSPLIDGPINVLEFHKLKCLFLQSVNVDEQFFSEFSLKFPCLEDLSLCYCDGYRGRRQISSHSLKCISVTETRMLWVNFDVPNIRKFTFSGPIIPRLSFTSALKEFESHVSISCYDKHVEVSWFHQLQRLLTKLTLSNSNISLTLWFLTEERIDHVGEIKGLPRPVLGNLILSLDTLSSMYFSAFLDAIFWSCRPKVITIYGFNGSCLLELLCNRLMQQVNENYWIPNQNVFGQDGLEEVSFESFEVTLKKWRSLPWQAFVDSIKVEENKGQFRIRLKWRAC